MTNETKEPTAPIVQPFSPASRDRPFIGPTRPAAPDLVGATPTQKQGDSHDIRVQGSQQEKDRKEYFEDLEARRKRAAEFEARRQQHKPKEPKVELGAIDEVLNVLEEAAEDFDASFGKINQPLIDAKIEVERLRGELAEAEARLDAIAARGDSVQRLTNAVRLAESQLQNLVSKAEAEEIRRLAAERYGWAISWDSISEENKKDFRKHASVLVLKTFYVPRTIVEPGQIPSVDSLQEQLHRVGQKLVALREHLAEVAH
jgi:archaellum component FlaC